MLNIYFLIPNTSNLNDDSIVYLAEGLKELNISFSSNINYWKLPGNSFLFNKTDASPNDFDVVIVSYKWTEHVDPFTFKTISNELPFWLFAKTRKYLTVYLDPRDGYNTLSFTQEYRKFDYILRAKKNSLTKNHDNIYPWVLGFQNRISNERIGIRTKDKTYNIAVNFNYSHPYQHQLRKLSEEQFLSKLPPSIVDRTISAKEKPIDEFGSLMWENTIGLHNSKYYRHTERCLMIAAFCGELIPALPLDPSLYLRGGKKALIMKKIYTLLSFFSKKQPRSIQWDSWRFWEALALGSVPIHIDLEKYGVELPVMPKNWEHYIGIDLDNVGYTIDKILEDREAVYNIAEQGHRWAMAYYSPKKSAERFLELLSSG